MSKEEDSNGPNSGGVLYYHFQKWEETEMDHRESPGCFHPVEGISSAKWTSSAEGQNSTKVPFWPTNLTTNPRPNCLLLSPILLIR